MSIEIENRGNLCHIAIRGEMLINQAAAMKEPLLQGIASAEKIEVNLAEVDELDSAGLQLLALIKRESLQQGRELAFTHHSPAVTEVIELCDLARTFGDPVLITANH